MSSVHRALPASCVNVPSVLVASRVNAMFRLAAARGDIELAADLTFAWSRLCRMHLAPIHAGETPTSPSLSEQSAMENTKIYLGLIAVWAMMAWMAWEFAWDAWQNARRNKGQRQTPENE